MTGSTEASAAVTEELKKRAAVPGKRKLKKAAVAAEKVERNATTADDASVTKVGKV